MNIDKVSKKTGILLAGLISAGSLAGPVVSAGAAALPPHAPGPVSCNSSTRTVTAYPPPAKTIYSTPIVAPGYMYSFYSAPSRERVRWSSSLDQWNGSQWVTVDDSSDPWHYAFANTNGLQNWYLNGTYVWSKGLNDGTSFPRFDYPNLPNGFYRVWNWFRWDGTGEGDELPAVKYNGALGVGYCQIG